MNSRHSFQIGAAALLAFFLLSCSSGTSGTTDGTISSMRITYYYLVMEADDTGAKDTEIRDVDCNAIATVPSAFAEELCTEGSGRLDDGRVVNFSQECACGSSCAFRGTTVCFTTLDAETFPWGAGSQDNALDPLHSWAVDPDVLSFGTVVYVPDWDGVSIPSIDGIGGFVHDGCFRVDDVGFGVTGNHFDFFAGTRSMFEALEGIFDSGTTFDVNADPGKCDYLNR